jgi:two-component system, chemotaxis family, chemotaxis protein CheY
LGRATTENAAIVYANFAINAQLARRGNDMASKRTALIMELTPSRRSLLAELLQELGFTLVVEALSPDNALERMNMIAFDAVFFEVATGDENAFAFVRNLRLDRTRDFRGPIVVVSADSQRGAIERARDAGANGFLARPFSVATLKLQIARAINDERPYIASAAFAGPDRRRFNDPQYSGPERRRQGASDIIVV